MVAGAARGNDEPLNILFILTDDQAADTIAAHGNERISTPSIDRLADSGMSFTHVFNQGSWSGAVCAPSRRMINTGRHIYRTGSIGVDVVEHNRAAIVREGASGQFEDVGGAAIDRIPHIHAAGGGVEGAIRQGEGAHAKAATPVAGF